MGKDIRCGGLIYILDTYRSSSDRNSSFPRVGFANRLRLRLGACELREPWKWLPRRTSHGIDRTTVAVCMQVGTGKTGKGSPLQAWAGCLKDRVTGRRGFSRDARVAALDNATVGLVKPFKPTLKLGITRLFGCLLLGRRRDEPVFVWLGMDCTPPTLQEK